MWLILGLWKIYQKCFLAKNKSNQENDGQVKTEDENLENKELISRLAALPDSDV